MRDNDPIQGLGLECPSGSTFHICKNDPNRFIGCCGINPCGARKGLCPDQRLYAASFDKAYEEYIPSQACTNDNVDVAWHACSWSTSSFMGCCAVDPCSGGCPGRELRAARLSDDSKNAELFLGEGYDYPPEPGSTHSTEQSLVTSTSVSSATAITTAAISSFLTSYTLDTISEADTSSVESAAPSQESHDHSKDDICVSKGGLAGIMITLLFLFIAAIWKVWKHKSHKNKGKDDDEKSNTSDDGGLVLAQQTVRRKAAQTPDQSKHCSVQPTSPPDTSHHFEIHHPYDASKIPDQSRHHQLQPTIQPTIQPDTFHHPRPNHPINPTLDQKKPEAARQTGNLQLPPTPLPSKSPPPKNNDVLPTFPQPSELPGDIPGIQPDQRFSFDLEGSSVRDFNVKPPSPLPNPSNVQSNTRTPHDSLSYVMNEMAMKNVHTPNRKSDTSKIGTASTGGVRLSDPGAKFDSTKK
ncbi:hypothetical protein FPOAC2_07809 [Fusarium poae]|uniref:hypothetical protein n=1 Tax=Fusarium poae TaxID=36050 RepID=UPI001CE8742A|nr:hypothetical protein FPOAC1_007902 [Fusarium poae]KAG8668519.1 hypothetical protein FPOAC1_007902 [Fusarium poae]